ncbi:hypothetical protein MSP8887_01567 [Marinomonas spartinae]|uniref:DUF2167 domain-containing protein n=1 Tax=Marinomonas spartinae TaxID=1792290 RepID=A0A1A8TTI5_9GAMM|nr:DUF2167 domain-containing protein [Marinomonas spartinae]SBS31666.1 hypothetical protein MSP8887_01567 [Marinomonas spartinae]SBS36369.1 hypothetical protein MSP8886_03672 [Marinomonas spartinae]
MRSLIVLWLACFSFYSFAADSDNVSMTNEQFLQQLHPQSGDIILGNGVAELSLTDKFQYLSPKSTERLLVDGWGNPPGNKTLGMLIPANTNPLSNDGWGVVITYQKDGHVKDSDAKTIDYNELLQKMKKETQSESKERVKQGYGSMELVGWAQPPRYDQATHKFYWAEDLKTSDSREDSLNYNIRVLGREGVLVLNVVGGMSQLHDIEKETPALLAVTNFTKGNRYADFDSKTDHVAEYGLAALVAGGVAAKMGLFAKLLALLIAFKKVIIIGVAAFGGVIMKLFRRKK